MISMVVLLFEIDMLDVDMGVHVFGVVAGVVSTGTVFDVDAGVVAIGTNVVAMLGGTVVVVVMAAAVAI